MKIRCDFVSNSSSCSFIIEAKYIKHMADVVDEKLYELSVPYFIENELRIYVHAKNKNIDELYQLLEDDMQSKPSHYENEDPEDISWNSIELTVSGFIDLMHKKDHIVLDLIEHVEFNTEDYGPGPIYLRDFYGFFDRNKCALNDECSEHEFTFDDNTSFMNALKRS